MMAYFDYNSLVSSMGTVKPKNKKTATDESVEKADSKETNADTGNQTATVSEPASDEKIDIDDIVEQSGYSNDSERDAVLPSAETSSKKSSVVGRKTRAESDFSNLRLARNLLRVVKQSFPEASNQDALAAYIIVKSGLDIQVSPAVDDLVASYNGNQQAVHIDKRLEHLEKQMQKLTSAVNEITLCVSYLVFDRMGFRNEDPSDPRMVNFLENGIDDLQTRLSEQAQQLKRQRDYQNGRPIR